AIERWTTLYSAELNVSFARGRILALVGAARSGLTFLAPLLILLIGGHLVIAGTLSLGAMLSIVGLSSSFLLPLDALVDAGLSLASLRSYADRLDDILSSPVERRGDEEQVEAVSFMHANISVDNVAFRYSEAGPWVLKDVTFDIPAGKLVAIVGKSGSGKSTLAKLLLGLYRPTAGRIRFGEQDLMHLDLQNVRKNIGVVPQVPHVFPGTIRDNISLGLPCADADIVEAAQKACLHDDIAAMPMAYGSVIADGGASLSGGQRQRLAIARALLRRPGVVVFDEATSSLDAITEAEVMANIAKESCTRIVVAHRLSTIRGADVILVLGDGALVEQGAHEQLLARDGAYAALVARQTSDERSSG
ncbi:MAG: ATP-binding cassette domain-containing protein, partial [Kofleriaceae bacterium]